MSSAAENSDPKVKSFQTLLAKMNEDNNAATEVFKPYLDETPGFEIGFQYRKWKEVLLQRKDDKFFRLGDEDFELDQSYVAMFDGEQNCFDLLLGGKKFLLYYRDVFQFYYEPEANSISPQYWPKTSYITTVKDNKPENICIRTPIIFQGTLNQATIQKRVENNQSFISYRFMPSLLSTDDSNVYPGITVKTKLGTDLVQYIEYNKAKRITVKKMDTLGKIYLSAQSTEILACIEDFRLKIDNATDRVYIHGTVTHIVYFSSERC